MLNMNWYKRFYKKEKWVKKSVEIEGNLYDRLKEISANELDASINKIIDACVDDFKLEEKLVIYKKEKNEIDVARSIIIRESMYKKLEEMREKYGISMPIVNEVKEVLFEGKDPKAAVNELMMREGKVEYTSLTWDKQ